MCALAEPVGIQSTAGAIPVRNEKGEISMQKVKVHRYISGKRPDYARGSSSSEDTDLEDFIDYRRRTATAAVGQSEGGRENSSRHRDGDDDHTPEHNEDNDPRLRRLRARPLIQEELEIERKERHRHIHEPEIADSEPEEEEEDIGPGPQPDERLSSKIRLATDSESDAELSESEMQNKRQRLRQRMLQQQMEEEVLQKEDEKQSSESSDNESSEYGEESETEEENEPRLKPLFVQKRDRATIQEKEREAQKQKVLEVEAKRAAKERRRCTLRLVEESVKKDLEKAKPDTAEASIDDVCTDDENDEVEYEAWKLRELKRMKRDREERDIADREKLQIDRMRNLTDEERRQEMRVNPKIITNKATKGKYKFLQKYYHRGAFYLDEESDVLKRDFAQATLEDHFDKTILPKVMQVKNFGRCGRTKYTHLVDQDTTKFDSPWYADTSNNIKFHNDRAGGMKQVFDRPTRTKRRRME